MDRMDLTWFTLQRQNIGQANVLLVRELVRVWKSLFSKWTTTAHNDETEILAFTLQILNKYNYKVVAVLESLKYLTRWITINLFITGTVSFHLPQLYSETISQSLPVGLLVDFQTHHQFGLDSRHLSLQFDIFDEMRIPFLSLSSCSSREEVQF